MQPSEKFTTIVSLLQMNEHIPYVVIKGWDEIGYVTTEVLVLNRKEFVAKLSLKKDRSAPQAYRTLYKWRYGVNTYKFEVKEIGDNFYHPTLGERLLKGRIKHDEMGFYVVNPKDYFFEILYR